MMVLGLILIATIMDIRIRDKNSDTYSMIRDVFALKIYHIREGKDWKISYIKDGVVYHRWTDEIEVFQ